MSDVLWNLGYLTIGAAVTWLVSKGYYEKASHDLTQETEKLRKLINTFARAMDAEGWITGTWDEDGNLAGFVVHTGAEIKGTSKMSAKPPSCRYGWSRI